MNGVELARGHTSRAPAGPARVEGQVGAGRIRGWIGAGVVRVLSGLIQIYQVTISPLLGPRCRFEPSCSRYAREALHQHGPVRGSALAVRRLLRCHPFHPGGLDPVPLPGETHAADSPDAQRCSCGSSPAQAEGAP